MGSCCSYEKKEDYKNKEEEDDDNHECYKYQIRIIDTHDNIRHKGHIVTEFFILNKNVCFNQQSAFRSNRPRNDGKIYPMTIVKVPTNIINKIIKIAELQGDGKKTQARDIMLALNFTKQFHDLFIN